MKKIIALLIIGCFLLTSCSSKSSAESPMEFVANMGVGWNLGNTLDAKGKDETTWNNPVTTKAMIDAVRAQGFKTLRVPVTWQYHMGKAPDYTIEDAWLNRVEEIVNYGLSNDMYVIINIHHDEEWMKPSYEKAEQVKIQLEKVWQQVANHFKAFDQQLIFETLNEPRIKGSAKEWKGGTEEGRDCVNQFHRVCVDAIRATGGNNKTRKIMVSTYAANGSAVAVNDLKLPDSENLIVSIHNYFPHKFCQGDEVQTWGSEKDMQLLDKELDRLVEVFINKGIPVVMGEWGSKNQDNKEARVTHSKYYAEGCLKRGICPIWWDNGNKNEFGIFDRRNLSWFQPEIAEVIVKAQDVVN